MACSIGVAFSSKQLPPFAIVSEMLNDGDCDGPPAHDAALLALAQRLAVRNTVLARVVSLTRFTVPADALDEPVRLPLLVRVLGAEGFSPAESTAAARKRPAKVNFKAFTVLLLESCSLRRESGARLVYGD